MDDEIIHLLAHGRVTMRKAALLSPSTTARTSIYPRPVSGVPVPSLQMPAPAGQAPQQAGASSATPATANAVWGRLQQMLQASQQPQQPAPAPAAAPKLAEDCCGPGMTKTRRKPSYEPWERLKSFGNEKMGKTAQVPGMDPVALAQQAAMQAGPPVAMPNMGTTQPQLGLPVSVTPDQAQQDAAATAQLLMQMQGKTAAPYSFKEAMDANLVDIPVAFKKKDWYDTNPDRVSKDWNWDFKHPFRQMGKSKQPDFSPNIKAAGITDSFAIGFFETCMERGMAKEEVQQAIKKVAALDPELAQPLEAGLEKLALSFGGVGNMLKGLVKAAPKAAPVLERAGAAANWGQALGNTARSTLGWGIAAPAVTAGMNIIGGRPAGEGVGESMLSALPLGIAGGLRSAPVGRVGNLVSRIAGGAHTGAAAGLVGQGIGAMNPDQSGLQKALVNPWGGAVLGGTLGGILPAGLRRLNIPGAARLATGLEGATGAVNHPSWQKWQGSLAKATTGLPVAGAAMQAGTRGIKNSVVSEIAKSPTGQMAAEMANVSDWIDQIPGIGPMLAKLPTPLKIMALLGGGGLLGGGLMGNSSVAGLGGLMGILPLLYGLWQHSQKNAPAGQQQPQAGPQATQPTPPPTA